MEDKCAITVLSETPITSVREFIDFFASAVGQCHKISSAREIEVIMHKQGCSQTDYHTVSAKVPGGIRELIHETASKIDESNGIIGIVIHI